MAIERRNTKLSIGLLAVASRLTPVSPFGHYANAKIQINLECAKIFYVFLARK